MRRCLSFVLGILLLGAPSVGAVENSNLYAPLANSPTFLNRVQYILVQEAPVVEAEAVAPYSATCHTLRTTLAAAVAANPSTYRAIFAAHLVANINVTSGGALTGTVSAGTLDTPASDAALFAAAASLWSAVSGCIAN